MLIYQWILTKLANYFNHCSFLKTILHHKIYICNAHVFAVSAQFFTGDFQTNIPVSYPPPIFVRLCSRTHAQGHVGWIGSMDVNLVHYRIFFRLKRRHTALVLFISLFLYSFIHSFVHSFTHSLTHSLTHSVTHSLTHSLIHSFIHSLIHSFIHSSKLDSTYSVNKTVVSYLTHTMLSSYLVHQRERPKRDEFTQWTKTAGRSVCILWLHDCAKSMRVWPHWSC